MMVFGVDPHKQGHTAVAVGFAASYPDRVQAMALACSPSSV
jgi:hypothetical protein